MFDYLVTQDNQICTVQRIEQPEPKFLNILKCNSAESVSAGFQFNCYGIFYVQALLYSLTFEKTALCEKSTFQPPVNV